MINAETIGIPLASKMELYNDGYPKPNFMADLVHEDSNENPRDFFTNIVKSMMKGIQEDDDSIVIRKYLKDSTENNDFMVLQKLKTSAEEQFGPCRKQLNIRYHPNIICPQMKHVPVLPQCRGSLCGFHTLYNAKCFLKSILSTNKFDCLKYIC